WFRAMIRWSRYSHQIRRRDFPREYDHEVSTDQLAVPGAGTCRPWARQNWMSPRGCRIAAPESRVAKWAVWHREPGSDNPQFPIPHRATTSRSRGDMTSQAHSDADHQELAGIPKNVLIIYAVAQDSASVSLTYQGHNLGNNADFGPVTKAV